MQKAYDVKDTAVTTKAYANNGTTLDVSGLDDAAIKAATGGTNGTASVTGGAVKFDADNNKYFVTIGGFTGADAAKNGDYEVNVATDGTVTLAAGATKTTMPAGATTKTEVQELKDTPAVVSADAKNALIAGGVDATDANGAELVKMSYTDKNGKTIEGGYALKAGDKYYAADYDEATGAIKAKTTSYTAADGTTKTAANQLGGVDGKTEVVTIDGKTYNASKAAGHDFKAQPELAEAAAKTTENPLQKIDAALAQVDALRSDLGAVQNRFNSAITNPGNTVNNLSEARSRIEDSDYATEVSTCLARRFCSRPVLPFWRRLTSPAERAVSVTLIYFVLFSPVNSGLFISIDEYIFMECMAVNDISYGREAEIWPRDYSMLARRVQFLRFNDIPVRLVSNNARIITGYIAKFNPKENLILASDKPKGNKRIEVKLESLAILEELSGNDAFNLSLVPADGFNLQQYTPSRRDYFSICNKCYKQESVSKSI